MSKPIWAPGQIQIMIHHHCCVDRYAHAGTDFYRETLEKFIALGLIEYRDGVPRTTPLGAAFVDLLMQTPVPVPVYVDPRFAENERTRLALDYASVLQNQPANRAKAQRMAEGADV